MGHERIECHSREKGNKIIVGVVRQCRHCYHLFIRQTPANCCHSVLYTHMDFHYSSFILHFFRYFSVHMQIFRIHGRAWCATHTHTHVDMEQAREQTNQTHCPLYSSWCVVFAYVRIKERRTASHYRISSSLNTAYVSLSAEACDTNAVHPHGRRGYFEMKENASRADNTRRRRQRKPSSILLCQRNA